MVVIVKLSQISVALEREDLLLKLVLQHNTYTKHSITLKTNN